MSVFIQIYVKKPIKCVMYTTHVTVKKYSSIM